MVGVDTAVFHGYVNCGATGAITGIGNVLPKEVLHLVGMCEAAGEWRPGRPAQGEGARGGASRPVFIRRRSGPGSLLQASDGSERRSGICTPRQSDRYLERCPAGLCRETVQAVPRMVFRMGQVTGFVLSRLCAAMPDGRLITESAATPRARMPRPSQARCPGLTHRHGEGSLLGQSLLTRGFSRWAGTHRGFGQRSDSD